MPQADRRSSQTERRRDLLAAGWKKLACPFTIRRICFFTEDEEQNRRLVTVDRKELLSFQDAVSAWGMEALRNGAQRALRFIGSGKRKLSELDQIAVWTKLCTNRQLEDVYGQELRCRLAVWLSEQEKNKELNAFLRTLSKEQIAEKDRLCMARLMILHGFMTKHMSGLPVSAFANLSRRS